MVLGKLPVPGPAWIRVGQGPTALAVGAGGCCLDIFSFVYHFSFLSPSLLETARYRLKYCLKGPLSPKKQTNQYIHTCRIHTFRIHTGWSDGAMVLGKLLVPGRPTIWITVGQGPTALAVDAGGGCWTFLLSSILSLLFLPLFGRRPDID